MAMGGTHPNGALSRSRDLVLRTPVCLGPRGSLLSSCRCPPGAPPKAVQRKRRLRVFQDQQIPVTDALQRRREERSVSCSARRLWLWRWRARLEPRGHARAGSRARVSSRAKACASSAAPRGRVVESGETAPRCGCTRRCARRTCQQPATRHAPREAIPLMHARPREATCSMSTPLPLYQG